MKPLKVLALTRYGQLGASSRLRVLQFIKPLAKLGIEVDFQPLFDDENLQAYYDNRRPKLSVGMLRSLSKRIKTLLSIKDYDVVWMQKETLPFVPWPVEHFFELRLPPIVVDYDDAIFHNYDLHKSAFVRGLLGRKIDHVMAHAHTVIVGNNYLGDRARFAGAKNIAVIPTVLDPTRYHQATSKAKFRIGWIGTKSTSSYLNSIAPALAMAEKQLAAEIVIIGVSHCKLEGVSPTFLKWTEETEANQLAQLSIGIMPLTDSPWERGKCGYKILQYMASGVPSVASPVGVNNKIITNGTTGILATTVAEWFEAFKFIYENPKTAEIMGAAAVTRVKSNYSIDVVLPQIAQCLTNAAKTRST